MYYPMYSPKGNHNFLKDERPVDEYLANVTKFSRLEDKFIVLFCKDLESICKEKFTYFIKNLGSDKDKEKSVCEDADDVSLNPDFLVTFKIQNGFQYEDSQPVEVKLSTYDLDKFHLKCGPFDSYVEQNCWVLWVMDYKNNPHYTINLAGDMKPLIVRKFYNPHMGNKLVYEFDKKSFGWFSFEDKNSKVGQHFFKNTKCIQFF